MTNERKDESVFRPLDEKTFTFRCHREIACFTRCCAKLTLILTPYDIIRIKNRLHLNSDVFLDRFTDTNFDTHPRFPMVNLKMRDDEDRTCPFVARDGCTIYEDRPGACRIYPLGRATSRVNSSGKTLEKYFVVKEEHCLGFREDTDWTLDKWMANEGVDAYNGMNDQWSEIITARKSMGPEEDLRKKLQMFFMASYNLDKFRRFVFDSKFLSIFQIKETRVDTLASDEIALMRFATDWLKFSLYGEKTMVVKH